MNVVVAGNDDYRPIDIAGHAQVAGASRHHTTVIGLSRLEHSLIQAILPITAVDALYADTDDENLMMVFVVVREHDDAVYDAVLAAEAQVEAQASAPFELRVRAHQGRHTRCAVPLRSMPLFVR